MIDKILEFSVRQRVLVLMGALVLLGGGIWSVTKLPMDAIPDITGVQVQVNTTVPALAPDEVEKLVTVPLEMALGGVADVTEMRSLSRFGLSQITLQFTDKTDIYRARQLVTERLQSAADSLPSGLTPSSSQSRPGSARSFITPSIIEQRHLTNPPRVKPN
jgi:cobalt-zinc-cadmium resistance protein CzcA